VVHPNMLHLIEFRKDSTYPQILTGNCLFSLSVTDEEKTLFDRQSVYVDATVGSDERQFSPALEVDISNNPLDCNCTLKSLGNVVKLDLVPMLSNFFPSSLTMTPNNLEGLPLETLSSQVVEFEGKAKANPIEGPFRCFLLG
jgi:hypothetical protein